MMRTRNLSEEEFTALVKRRDRDAIDAAVPRGGKPSQEARPANKVKSAYRSKLEGAFSQKLAFEKMAGLLSYVAYEPMNLRLPGSKNFYKPDFLVMDEQRKLIFYEVKGRNLSDDRSLVKLKVAAAITPWAQFVLVKRINGEWNERIISAQGQRSVDY
jgi:hypothetical protein